MRDIAGYLSLVTSEHADKPKFMATIAASVAALANVQFELLATSDAFDLDTAVGVQLDAVGKWAGISRTINIPLPSPWFSFDDPIRGLDKAPMKGTFDVGTYLTRLDDDTFRRLIRAKIIANKGDGTIASAYAALAEFLTDTGSLLIVTDDGFAPNANLFFAFDDPARGLDGPAVLYTSGASLATLSVVDMHLTIGVAGVWPSTVDAEILSQKLIPVKPEGVGCDVLFSSVNGAPLFGFDVENQFISGCDVGAMGVSADYIANNAT